MTRNEAFHNISLHIEGVEHASTLTALEFEYGFTAGLITGFLFAEVINDKDNETLLGILSDSYRTNVSKILEDEQK